MLRHLGLPTEISETRPVRAPPLPLDARARHVRDGRDDPRSLPIGRVAVSVGPAGGAPGPCSHRLPDEEKALLCALRER